MLLRSKDIQGDIGDNPSNFVDYEANKRKFLAELESLNAHCKHHTWISSLLDVKVYRGKDGIRVAMPSTFHPMRVETHKYFNSHLLSNTVFPNEHQALHIAASIMFDYMGH